MIYVNVWYRIFLLENPQIPYFKTPYTKNNLLKFMYLKIFFVRKRRIKSMCRDVVIFLIEIFSIHFY